ncbi:MAG TPA: response regulator [Pyrinomonadaceae bacterium]|jgi:DNA-binding response OmpR family regulator
MASGTLADQTPRDRDRARARRVLVCESSAAGAAFAARLSGAGYEVRRASAETARREIESFAPQLVVVEFDAGDDAASVARRAGGAGVGAPLVVVYGVRVEAPREAARACAADDCFALATPTPQALARLDSVFWRVGAGRDLASADAARAARERHTEIEGFMQLLDAARAEFDAGAAGALALLAAVARDDREAVLREAHEFFRANLRRADAVAFYGPDLLVAHLPRRRPDSARDDLTKLCREFDGDHARARIAVGVARCPEDGSGVEELIERAEAALEAARSPGSHSRVVFHSRRDGEGRDGQPPVERSNSSGPAADASDADGTAHAPPSLTFEDARAPAAEESARAALPPTPAATTAPTARGRESSLKVEAESSPDAHDSSAPSGVRETARVVGRALRESSRGGESFETSVLSPQQGAAGGGGLTKSAEEAARRERELRAAGARMPRRVLLTVSDPARMAQVNLLLRSAGYEVRAAFDGGQALDLLRIERADLLLLDYDLKLLDGLEVLRRLGERHRGQLPIPALLLYPPSASAPPPAGALVREEAGRLGAAGLVELPYDPAELLAAVRESGRKD